MRFFVLLFKIPTQNQVVAWVVNTGNSLVTPFKGILEDEIMSINGFNVELTSIVAFFFFLIVGFVAIEIVKAFSAN